MPDSAILRGEIVWESVHTCQRLRRNLFVLSGICRYGPFGGAAASSSNQVQIYASLGASIMTRRSSSAIKLATKQPLIIYSSSSLPSPLAPFTYPESPPLLAPKRSLMAGLPSVVDAPFPSGVPTLETLPVFGPLSSKSWKSGLSAVSSRSLASAAAYNHKCQ